LLLLGFYVDVCVVLGFENGASQLLGRHSATWAMTPGLRCSYLCLLHS
jgi:hypothetical protein